MSPAKSRNLIATFCVIAMSTQSGCATPDTPSGRTRLADGSDPASGSVGLAMGRFPPTVHLEALVRGKGSGGAKGAAVSFDCLQSTKVDSIADALVCMPIAAIAGAVAGASKAAPKKEIEQAEVRLGPELEARAAAGQKALEDHLIQYAAEVGLSQFALLDNQGPPRWTRRLSITLASGKVLAQSSKWHYWISPPIRPDSSRSTTKSW